MELSMEQKPKTLKERLQEVFLEGFGGTTGFNPGVTETPGLTRLRDKIRKRKERQGDKRNKSKTGKDEEIIEEDPREFMQGEYRLSLKETFLKHIVDYLNENKVKHLTEALDLMEDYPQLKRWVQQESINHLPKGHFPVYAIREQFDEEIGKVAKRSGDAPKIWHVEKHSANNLAENFEDHYIMETKVSPDKTLLYVPAFTKMMESLIMGGKVMEPQNNVLRRARARQEIILPGDVNEGMVIHVGKKGI